MWRHHAALPLQIVQNMSKKDRSLAAIGLYFSPQGLPLSHG